MGASLRGSVAGGRVLLPFGVRLQSSVLMYSDAGMAVEATLWLWGTAAFAGTNGSCRDFVACT